MFLRANISRPRARTASTSFAETIGLRRTSKKREKKERQIENVLFTVRFGCTIVKEVELSKQQEEKEEEEEDGADGTFEKGRRRGGGIRNVSRMVIGLSRILVLVPVTVCATISLPLEDYSRCNDRRSPPQTLATCRYDLDCMENAYCWNQEACYCKDGYVVYRNHSNFHCLKVADNIEDPCVANVQCHLTFTLHSECRNHVCQCSSTAHFVNGRCYESIGLGRICQTNNNCYVKDSYCVEGYCVCDHRQHSNPERTKCIKNAYLGDKCDHDYECVSKSTKCMEVCRCKIDYVLSEDGTRCLKAANSVGEDCQENLQCQEFLQNTVCQNNICTCIEDYHRRGPVCVRDVGLGQRCVSHNECVTRTYKHSNSSELMNVDCSNDRCTCAENYIMSQELDDCIRYSESGATSWQAYGIFSLIIFVNVSLWMLRKTM
ncbi:prion-like-(Q/N-rich) domain-bearing protein 25 isoform X1 [Vespa mandarinia]|uniref:prion-like-(Q/N-rich) domain-bearing protein 25 isoform X1 n=2 Tax=Vespa mandarinia TaxID=7446 RepID=UPI00160FEDC9|nr:prion-like-(Q/N-rich) domain-bearing protein 25 isoform X1 [Vespa mandarinia]